MMFMAIMYVPRTVLEYVVETGTTCQIVKPSVSREMIQFMDTSIAAAQERNSVIPVGMDIIAPYFACLGLMNITIVVRAA